MSRRKLEMVAAKSIEASLGVSAETADLNLNTLDGELRMNPYLPLLGGGDFRAARQDNENRAQQHR